MMIFAFVVLVALVLMAVYALVLLAKWPKGVAVKRNHPYPDAVNVLSWGGLLLTAGLAWLAALVWAHATPRSAGGSEDGDGTDLTERIKNLEAQIAALKA